MLGKIYCLVDKSKPKNIYIGSTCQDLELRLKQHIYAFKSYMRGSSSYYSVFDLFLNAQNYELDIEIKLIECVEIDNEINGKLKLKEKESEHIMKYKCRNEYNILNLNKPIDRDKYYINKAYRNFYNKGNKSTKIYIKCPHCTNKIKVSISPLLENHYFNDCIDYKTDSDESE